MQSSVRVRVRAEQLSQGILSLQVTTYRAETEGPVNNIDSITQYRALHSLQTPSVPVVLELFGLCMYCALNTIIYIES